MTEQKMDGGVPVTRLTPSDIITYYGAIVGSNAEGDLYSWDGESDAIRLFNAIEGGTWDYSDFITEDFAGRDLKYIMDYCQFYLA